MAKTNIFLSIPKAAERCGVDRRTMWRWVKSGRIDALVTPGGHHRVLQTDIDALIAPLVSERKAVDRPKKILLVDDDPSVLRTLGVRLRRMGYEVVTASDGFSAGLKARDALPDLIVLDLMMEGVDGFEVCRSIRRDSKLRKARILIFTGFDSPENRQRARREGADDYLPKSGDVRSILEKIESLVTEDKNLKGSTTR